MFRLLRLWLLFHKHMVLTSNGFLIFEFWIGKVWIVILHSACVPNEFSYILPTNFIRARHMTDAWRRNDHVAFRRPMYPADFVQVLKYGLHLDGLSPKKQPLVITCCFNFRAVGNWKTSNKLNIFSLRYFRCMLYWFLQWIRIGVMLGLALCWLGAGNQAGASACAYMNISHNHRDRFDKLLIRPAGTCPCF